MEKPTLYPVEICLAGQTRTYSAEFQTDPQYADGWKRVLLLAHGKADVRCCCPGPGSKHLSIHSHSNSDRFHLARFPESGPEHAEDCVYYGVDPTMSGLGAYKRGVVQELDDGSVKIKLKLGLQQRPASAPDDDPAAPAAKPTTSRGRSGQASMTLLGLLHYLWTQVGLNTWSPGMEGKRTLGLVHYHLVKMASATYVGRTRLAQNLLVATPTGTGSQATYNQAKALEAITQRRRLVVVAPLARHAEGLTGGTELPIAAFHGIPHLTLGAETWDSMKRRFERELNAWAAGNWIIAIVQTEPPRSSGGAVHARVLDVALMQVTKQWIPVDSGYEALVADKLVAERRRFEKPLRFDAGEDAVLPDFWLRDTESPVPLEVWGLTSAEYLARRTEKVKQYDERYGAQGWWSWDAAQGDLLEPFPPAFHRGNS